MVKLIVFDYVDFPQSSLERLYKPQDAFEKPVISAPSNVEASSRWTYWAMKLLPGTFLVDTKINGYRASLVVDTGAFASLLSPHLATKAQVSLIQKRPKVALLQDIKQDIYVGLVHELTIGDLRVVNLPVIVPDRQAVIKLLGIPIWRLDGLLGMETLQRLAFTLDYAQGIVILRREPVSPQGDSAPLQIVSLKPTIPGLEGFELHRPIVEGFVNSHGPYPCFIDTGTSAPVSVPPEIWQALGLENQKQAQLEIRLGELQLKGVPAVRANVGQILIGSNIFQAQGFKRLTLDFLAGKLYLER